IITAPETDWRFPEEYVVAVNQAAAIPADNQAAVIQVNQAVAILAVNQEVANPEVNQVADGPVDDQVAILEDNPEAVADPVDSQVVAVVILAANQVVASLVEGLEVNALVTRRINAHLEIQVDPIPLLLDNQAMVAILLASKLQSNHNLYTLPNIKKANKLANRMFQILEMTAVFQLIGYFDKNVCLTKFIRQEMFSCFYSKIFIWL
ncbi:hypothetical protein HW555_010140, partial [Spodoptera exigua]